MLIERKVRTGAQVKAEYAEECPSPIDGVEDGEFYLIQKVETGGECTTHIDPLVIYRRSIGNPDELKARGLSTCWFGTSIENFFHGIQGHYSNEVALGMIGDGLLVITDEDLYAGANFLEAALGVMLKGGTR